MSNNSKKYVSLNRLSNFLDNIKSMYSQIGHKHTISDLSDYTIDTTLSPTSNNPVANSTLDAEFNAISDAMGALELAVDDKADISHNHNDLYYTETEIDNALAKKSQVQMIISNISKVLSTLNIHKLTQEEYNQGLINGTLNEDTLYLTPDEEIDLTPYATIEQLNAKANASHTHDDVYYTESEMDTMLLDKADTTHNHDDAYETKGSVEIALNSAKSYADNAASSVKDDLLNGASAAYDTLKELGDLINENTDAIEALEIIASGKANADHTHNDIYYTETEIDEKVSTINTLISNSLNEAKSYSNSNLNAAQTYTDNAVAQKSQVQIITWEDDD